MFETRVDLSNDMSHDLAANDWGGFCLFGVRRVVLAGGELDKLEGPKYAARRGAELRERFLAIPNKSNTHTSFGAWSPVHAPKYAARLRRKAGEAARARDRQAAAASQDEADESDATEEEATGGRTTRVGRPRGGMKVAARIGEGLRREIERGRRPRVGVGDG